MAVRLLREAAAVVRDSKFAGYQDIFGLVLVLPGDYFDLLDPEAENAIRLAAHRADEWSAFVDARLAPVGDGWRDRLAELEDWADDGPLHDDWAVINERVHELRSLFHRAITPDDRADVGRRCRELLIAAANATYRPTMLPDGADPPKDSDAKTKCRYIVDHVGANSVDARLAKLIDRAWDLAVGLLHHDEPARVATFAAAQATILVVRTLAMIEGSLPDA